MAKGIGRRIQVGIAKEGTRGTVESAATYWVPFTEFTVDEKPEKIMNDQTHGVIEDSVGMAIAKKVTVAQGTFYAGDKILPLLLLNMLGSLSTGDNADSDASVKDHTLTVAQNNQHQALSLFVNDPLAGQDYKHATAMLERLTLDITPGKFVEVSIALRAKAGETATLTPATTSENLFLGQHATVKLATDLSGLDAANETIFKKVSLTFEPNLEDDDVVGDVTPADFLNKDFVVTGEVEALWDSETLKALVTSDVYRALRVDLVHTATIGSAANPRLKFDIAQASFTELTRQIKAGDLVRQTLSFKGTYSLSDSSLISALATNTVASY